MIWIFGILGCIAEKKSNRQVKYTKLHLRTDSRTKCTEAVIRQPHTLQSLPIPIQWIQKLMPFILFESLKMQGFGHSKTQKNAGAP